MTRWAIPPSRQPGPVRGSGRPAVRRSHPDGCRRTCPATRTSPGGCLTQHCQVDVLERGDVQAALCRACAGRGAPAGRYWCRTGCAVQRERCLAGTGADPGHLARASGGVGVAQPAVPHGRGSPHVRLGARLLVEDLEQFQALLAATGGLHRVQELQDSTSRCGLALPFAMGATRARGARTWWSRGRSGRRLGRGDYGVTWWTNRTEPIATMAAPENRPTSRAAAGLARSTSRAPTPTPR